MKNNKKRIYLKKQVELSVQNDQSKKIIHYCATHSTMDVLRHYHSHLTGLKEEDVIQNRRLYGINKMNHGKKRSKAEKLFHAFINPFVMILLVLSAVSALTDMIFPYFELFGNTRNDFDCLTVIIILSMVLISGILRYVQESRSGHAAEKLQAMITTTCSIKRYHHQPEEITLDKIVAGDIVSLSAGDLIPADLRILQAKDFFVSQSALTGESDPIEKTARTADDNDALTDYRNIVFMGSNVISGSALAIVINVGNQTIFGSIASQISQDREETSFTKGINQVSLVLIRFMMIMVPIVFVINGLTKGNWISAFLFAISIAVGLTPEMLPMIVTTCLAKGAVAMSKKKTIVKDLNAISNFGAIDILCSDKTGTITQDQIVLEYHLNVEGKEDLRVLRHAYLNSYFQTGYKNLMDKAIISKTEELSASNPELADLSAIYEKIDEIPFDFKRKRLTTVVKDRQGKTQMVTKGAVEEMLGICSYVQFGQNVIKLTADLKNELLKTVHSLNEKGLRVLAIAQKSNPSATDIFDTEDEKDMVLIGYLAFLDPPKLSAIQAIQALKKHHVTTKILTGDNEKVTRTICQQVGIKVNNMILGPQLEKLTDSQLKAIATKTEVFAKLTPDQKERIVRVLKDSGHTVGFMGDGINDASAMKTADIGISVDSAVDIAKESADIILLEKDLMVLSDGIIEGRKTYANMIKYIKMTASSNFGNMFSVLISSALLPFLPMASIHLIILNLIYDLSCGAIPWDNTDPEFLEKPRNWDASTIGSFMLWIGPVSSLFDILTYLFMYFVLCPLFVSHGYLYNALPLHFSGNELKMIQLGYIALFQTGWFVESMWSQTLVIHMIRSEKMPFIQSHASAFVCVITSLGIATLTIIPFTPLGKILNLVDLPLEYFWFLLPCLMLYMILVTIMKRIYIKRYGELL